MAVVPHTPYFYLLPRLKIHLKGRHFVIIEVIDEGSQAMLNTLTEHDLQDAFKNGRNSGNGAYTRKRITSRVIVASKPKVISWPDGSNSHGSYGCLLACYQLFLAVNITMYRIIDYVMQIYLSHSLIF
jgi:hypothetical protein